MERRNHYAALDGLRGLAAICVVLFHLGNWYGHFWLATNARLAVDFFFCLSGYVLSVAYRARLDAGLSLGTFVMNRLVRLMPIIVLGALVSAGYLVTRMIVLHDPAILPGEVAIALVLGIANVPMFTASSAIGGPNVFPLNAPQYTVFLEIVVNIVWVALRRFDGLPLALGIAIGGYALVATFGMAGDQVATFWTGFPRVFGTFYAGVAVFHAQRRYPALADPQMAILFLPLLALTVALFFWPHAVPLGVGVSWSAIVSPLLVLSGSHVRLAGRTQHAALAFGQLSYPIYALHYPIFVWVNAVQQQLMQRKDFALVTLLMLPAVVIGSILVLRLFDKPIRALMMRRFVA